MKKFSPEHIEMINMAIKIQALDKGLWFRAETATETYLQEALRNLHRVIEDMSKKALEEIKDI